MTDDKDSRADKLAASYGAKVAAALFAAISFWVVGNQLDASRTMREQEQVGFEHLKNEFAAREKNTTASSALGYFLLGGTGLACWATAPRRRLRFDHPLFWLAVLYVGWCGLTLLWSVDPMQTVRKFAIFSLMIIGAVGIAAKFDLEEFIAMSAAMLGLYAIVGIVAEAAYGNFRPWRSDYRFCGTMHPNDQALQCAVLTMAAWVTAASPRFPPSLRRALIVIGLAGVWFSKSRTTLAALVLAGVVYVFLRARGMQRWLVVSACLTLVGVGGILYNFVSVAVLKDASSVAEMGRHEDVSSLTGRLPLWQGLMQPAAKRPFMGYGYGAFWGSKNILKYSKMNGWHIPHAHNQYLDFVLATGFIGLVLHVVWVLTTTGMATIRYERSGRMAHLFVACLMMFSLVHGASESKLPGSGFPAFIMLAIMMMEAVQASAFDRAPRYVPLWLRSRAPRPALRPALVRGMGNRFPGGATQS